MCVCVYVRVCVSARSSWLTIQYTDTYTHTYTFLTHTDTHACKWDSLHTKRQTVSTRKDADDMPGARLISNTCERRKHVRETGGGGVPCLADDVCVCVCVCLSVCLCVCCLYLFLSLFVFILFSSVEVGEGMYNRRGSRQSRFQCSPAGLIQMVSIVSHYKVIVSKHCVTMNLLTYILLLLPIFFCCYITMVFLWRYN